MLLTHWVCAWSLPWEVYKKFNDSLIIIIILPIIIIIIIIIIILRELSNCGHVVLNEQ